MDIFEYSVVKIHFKHVRDAEDKLGPMKAFLDIVTYISDGSKPGEENVNTIDLDVEVHERRHQARFEEGPHPGDHIQVIDWDEVSVGANFCLNEMAPYLAMLGAQGWEVIEYKTASEPAIGQALLKRKVQTKE